MKKIHTRKLVIALFLMVLAMSVSSIAMSFAWFDQGANLEVGHLDMQVAADRNLKISLTNDNFKDQLDPSEVNDKIDFAPVSSMYSSEWISKKEATPKLKTGFLKGDFKDEKTFRFPNDATAGYWQKEIYLYSDYSSYITIDTAKPLFTANEDANKLKAKELYQLDDSKTEEEYLANLNSIAKSMRLSLLDPDSESYNYVIIDPYKESDTYLCGPLALNSRYYYDTSKDENDIRKEIVYGEYNDLSKIVYDEASDTDSNLKDPSKESSVFNARTKKETMGFNLSKSIANGFVPAIEDSLSSQEAMKKFMFPLEKETSKKLVLTMYLEGWDTDNTAEAMFGAFSANIQFKIAKENDK